MEFIWSDFELIETTLNKLTQLTIFILTKAPFEQFTHISISINNYHLVQLQ